MFGDWPGRRMFQSFNSGVELPAWSPDLVTWSFVAFPFFSGKSVMLSGAACSPAFFRNVNHWVAKFLLVRHQDNLPVVAVADATSVLNLFRVASR